MRLNHFIFIFLVLVFLHGCAQGIWVTDIESGEDLDARIRCDFDQECLHVRMPSGEKLYGQFCRTYDLKDGGNWTEKWSNYKTTDSLDPCEKMVNFSPEPEFYEIGHPQAYARLTSESSELTMDVWVNFDSPTSVRGKAETSDGRVFRIIF